MKASTLPHMSSTAPSLGIFYSLLPKHIRLPWIKAMTSLPVGGFLATEKGNLRITAENRKGLALALVLRNLK